jgi:hypothetical protein
VSAGPVFVGVAALEPLFGREGCYGSGGGGGAHFRSLIGCKMGPNDASRVVWAHLGRRRPFQPSPSSIELKYNIKR